MAQSNTPKVTRTTCPYCGVGCGVTVAQIAGGYAVAGDEGHPANFGRLCSKGAALGDILADQGRLLYPQINGVDTNWDLALGLVADTFASTIAKHGPDSVAFYVSGQLLTEDYYVANKLMKGFIGSGNIDTNSRLCMSSSVAGHIRAFGEDIVPGTYEDLELADLVILTGSNLAWCHPVLFQRLLAAKAQRPDLRIIAIDPRATATTHAADMHLALRPGSDVALWQGLLNFIASQGGLDQDYVTQHTTGFEAAISAAEGYDLTRISRETGLPPAQLIAFYKAFLGNKKTVSVYSQGVNQAADGTDRVNAIINCHLATGRMGKPGAGPFSITGQPNAMGGREVGGLANMLAAHMRFDEPAHLDTVRDFWAAPNLATKPGLKAVEMFDAVADGRIKAIWIMATNPVDSLPNADKVRDALKACPFVVVSDVTGDTDTAACADVLLPASAWGEKDGTVTNSERRISRQKAFKAPPGQAQADWAIVCDVARRMGFKTGFLFDGPAAIFREHAALSGQQNNGARGFDISALCDLSDADYDQLKPVQWPAVSRKTASSSNLPAAHTVAAQGVPMDVRFFSDGAFFTPERKARFIPVGCEKTDTGINVPAGLFILNTGRIRDQWHTMTRTGVSARLSQHLAEPFAQIHPQDAQRLDIAEASLVEITSPLGCILVRALITGTQAPGSVFVPLHWTDQCASAARVDSLIAPITDPVSGQPASKSTQVSVRPFNAQWHGFWVYADTAQSKQGHGSPGFASRSPAVPGSYWAQARCGGGYRVECAGQGEVNQAADDIHTRMIAAFPHAAALTYEDAERGVLRRAWFADETLLGACFISRLPLDLPRDWAAGLLSQDKTNRAHILAGRPGAQTPDRGTIICACMDVGLNTIRAACKAGALSIEAVGAKTHAGTNCGACRPEIKQEIDRARPGLVGSKPMNRNFDNAVSHTI